MAIPDIKYIVNDKGCHICTYPTANVRGYPLGKINGKQRRLSRYIYEKTYGQIPAGMCVCHKCDEPRCLNPEHLWLGTIQDNINDKIQKGRQVRGEKQGSSKLKKEEVEEIYMNIDMTQAQLAKKFNVNQRVIWSILNGITWVHVTSKLSPPKRKEYKVQPVIKITDETIKKIMEDNLPLNKLSEKYNVSVNYIYKIKTGRSNRIKVVQ